MYVRMYSNSYCVCVYVVQVNTIRAYGEEQNFISKLESSVDANTAPAVLQWEAGLWLGVRLDFIGALITFFVVAVAIITDQYLSAVTGSDFISAGYLALGLTYSFSLTQSLKFAVRVLAQGQVTHMLV